MYFYFDGFLLQGQKGVGIPITIDKALKPIWLQALNQEPALELHSRAAPSVEAHHCVNSPDTGRNSGGRRTVKKPISLFKQEVENL